LEFGEKLHKLLLLYNVITLIAGSTTIVASNI